MPGQRRVLIIGGSFAGLCAARDLATHFLVTIVDCKEFFEYTPGVLRCFVKPKHFDALSFNLHPIIEERMGCKFIWGEVTALAPRLATIKPMFSKEEEQIDFDYCIIAAGCNFGQFSPKGESLWFPTVQIQGREVSDWKHIDERFIEGRRRHIFEEYETLKVMSREKSNILVIGAGFIGVEWITELQYFFPGLKLYICDFLPLPLGPLPKKAAEYCKNYMEKKGIFQKYEIKYDAKSKDFWAAMTLQNQESVKKSYTCIGVKASNWFMPGDCLSEKGPGGGGWILMDETLAVKTRQNEIWSTDKQSYPLVYAVGDCNYACVEHPDGPTAVKPSEWPIPPIPKISYPGEEEAVIAVRNIEKIDHIVFHKKETDCFGNKLVIHNMHWPWGAGMFATSLGPHDACFVAGANFNKGSGIMVLWGSLSAVQKEVIEASKVNECQMGVIGRAIWHFVHHTPLHLWGGGPRFGY